MKKTRFLSLALTGTLCVSLLAGCGGSGDGGGAAQTPDAANTSTVQENTGSAFKLGGTGPLTGDAAIYGLAAQRGAQIAVDEIKEAGGDIQFALKYEDDVNVPETAVNAYNALKEWGMQISLGSVTSQPGVSTSALAFEDRIFTLRQLPRCHQRQGQRLPDVLLRPQPGPGLRPVYHRAGPG